MVKIATSDDARLVKIVGYGIKLERKYEISTGVFLTSEVPPVDLEVVAKNVDGFRDYASVVSASGISSFAVEIHWEGGGSELAVRAWNALWTFQLVAVAFGSPCFPLYSISCGSKPIYSCASHEVLLPVQSMVVEADEARLAWIAAYYDKYNNLIDNERFITAVIGYANAHTSPSRQIRIMQLWAGIESLFGVDAELRRRVALYAAIISNGSHAEKIAIFNSVKSAYDLRSRVVHGAKVLSQKLEEGYSFASALIVSLIKRCLEIGRVPETDELDRLAVSVTLRE